MRRASAENGPVADSIPWRIAIPAEVRCEYAGTTQGAYYTELETYLYTEEVFPARAHRLLSVCAETCIAFVRAVREVTGASPHGGAGRAPEMVFELTVGTPPENVRAYIEVAREYEG